MSASFRDTDHGWKSILGRAHSGPVKVKVGLLGEVRAERKDGDPLTNPEIGAVHEFGIDVPERSFLRSTVDKNKSRYRGYLKRLGSVVVKGRISPQNALLGFGQKVVGDVRATIQAGISPPLAPATLAAKTVNGKVGTTPLIDTGQLIGAIAAEIEGA